MMTKMMMDMIEVGICVVIMLIAIVAVELRVRSMTNRIRKILGGKMSDYVDALDQLHNRLLRLEDRIRMKQEQLDAEDRELRLDGDKNDKKTEGLGKDERGA